MVCDHIDIMFQKEEILGIDVIYFVAPTKENFNIILEDLNGLLYNSVYFCFNKNVFQNDIKYFYEKLIEIERASLVKGVWEINLNCVPIGN